MKLAWLGVLVIGLVSHGAAERLKFRGAFQDERNAIEFVLRMEATRTDPKANYTVSGVIASADGDYRVSGTLYAKTGKLRASVLRKNAVAGKPDFNQPLDGQLQPQGNKLIAKCLLLSPRTKVAMSVTFEAYKVEDSKESGAEITAYIRDKVAGSTSPDLVVNDLKGMATIRNRTASGQFVERVIRFTPLPPAFAFGGKWTFTLDASSIPKDEYCNFKVSLNYLDNTARSPYLEFDLSKGERTFSKTMTWNSPGNGYNGVSFTLNQEGPYVQYRVQKLKKTEFDRLTAEYNQSPGTGGTPNDGGRAWGTGGPVTLRTTAIRGDVQIRPRSATDWAPLTGASILSPGTMISVGPESSATLQLPDGSVITIQAGTELRVEDLSAAGGQARALVRIMAGSILYRHDGLSSIRRSDFVIAAAEATASVRGTDFTMTFNPKDNTIRIELRHGKLEFDPGRGLGKIPLEAPTTLTWKAQQ